MKAFFITLTVGVSGALLFQLAHIPMPWLLGPLFAVMLVRLTTPLPIVWHSRWKDIGLVLAGYSIGAAFTTNALEQLSTFLPLMVVINLIYIGLFLCMSRFIVARTQVDSLAALTSTVPGGLSQILAYAAEKKSAHITMITFYQVVRVLCILTIVPLTVAQQTTVATADIPYTRVLLPLLLLAYVAGIAAAKLRIPTGFMLGPVLLLIALQLANISIPPLPASALHIAQLLIGMYIGMLLQRKDLHLSKRTMFYGVVSAFAYIGFALILSYVVIQLYPIDFRTAFLSITPGGLDQMGLIAASVQADVAIVTAFQLFRVLVISIVVVPSLKWLTKA